MYINFVIAFICLFISVGATCSDIWLHACYHKRLICLCSKLLPSNDM